MQRSLFEAERWERFSLGMTLMVSRSQSEEQVRIIYVENWATTSLTWSANHRDRFRWGFAGAFEKSSMDLLEHISELWKLGQGKRLEKYDVQKWAPSFSDAGAPSVAFSSGSCFRSKVRGTPKKRCHLDAHDMGSPFGQGLPCRARHAARHRSQLLRPLMFSWRVCDPLKVLKIYPSRLEGRGCRTCRTKSKQNGN